jgi:hypothetical protein
MIDMVNPSGIEISYGLEQYEPCGITKFSDDAWWVYVTTNGHTLYVHVTLESEQKAREYLLEYLTTVSQKR